jgi:hypothetical protein
VSASDSWKLLVFRDGSRVCDGRQLLSQLLACVDGIQSLSDFQPQSSREQLLEALLRSGEFECAIADGGCDPEYLRSAASLTDALALALLQKKALQLSSETLSHVAPHLSFGKLSISPPEGFGYYALHPLDYAELLNAQNFQAPAAAVIGIRSIGTTLSAVVRGWFVAHGIPAERLSVRPFAHFFDRKLDMNSDQRAWISGQISKGALFFVVDEGPGLSGSSFLAVGEELVRAGVPNDRIMFLPSWEPDLGVLIAPNAAERWRKFKTISLRPTRYVPKDASEYIGAGQWRKRVIPSEADWPAVWSWTERQKYLSSDGQQMFRFDGYGHHGRAVRDRAQALAEQGWGPSAESAGDGFTAFPWVQGSREHAPDAETVKRLARYCAFRAETFRSDPGSQSSLEEMTVLNLERALGARIPGLQLHVERPVIADGRMMPYEWVRARDGKWLKVDASSHGDDHFYPGPCDIAWDVAGTIVEWNLGNNMADLLVSEYSRISRDQVAKRLPAYVISYCAFRLGFTVSASHSAQHDEQPRFAREADFYRNQLSRMLRLTVSA